MFHLVKSKCHLFKVERRKLYALFYSLFNGRGLVCVAVSGCATEEVWCKVVMAMSTVADRAVV